MSDMKTLGIAAARIARAGKKRGRDEWEGQQVEIQDGEITWYAKVVETRVAYGRIDLRVEPVAGRGSRWIIGGPALKQRKSVMDAVAEHLIETAEPEAMGRAEARPGAIQPELPAEPVCGVCGATALYEGEDGWRCPTHG